jgi:hypothetical protein
MALPSSGAISFSNVDTELGYSSSAQISLNDAAVRTLFGISSGAIDMNTGHGKSNFPAALLFVDVGNSSSYPGSGTTLYDISGNSRNGSFSGTHYPSYTGSGSSASLYFNPLSLVLFSGIGSGNFPSGAFTVSAWFNFAGLSNWRNVYDGNYGVYGGSGNTGPRLECDSGGNCGAPISGNSSNNDGYADGVTFGNSTLGYISASTWYNCVFVRDVSTSPPTLYGYKNGTLTDTESNGNDWVGSMLGPRLGQGFDHYGGSDRQFYGYISMFGIWNVAWTSAQVTTHWNTYKGRYGY